MINRRRFQDVVGVALMGDAVMHALGMKEHMRLWQPQSAPQSRYSRALQYLVDHPLAAGLVSAGEFALGYTLAKRAEAPTPDTA